jgi:hypothetical protein
MCPVRGVRAPRLGSKSGVLNPAGVLPPDSAQPGGIGEHITEPSL